MPSFKDFYLIKLANENNCFIHKWTYYAFFILTIDKFYELILDCLCSKQFFVIKKIVSTRQNVLENPKYSQFISEYKFLKCECKIIIDNIDIHNFNKFSKKI